jgi:hypothetical protein
MTLAEIAATCPGWRTFIRPKRAPFNYAADWAKRKLRGSSARRKAKKLHDDRVYYHRHRSAILNRLRSRRLSKRKAAP